MAFLWRFRRTYENIIALEAAQVPAQVGPVAFKFRDYLVDGVRAGIAHARDNPRNTALMLFGPSGREVYSAVNSIGGKRPLDVNTATPGPAAKHVRSGLLQPRAIFDGADLAPGDDPGPQQQPMAKRRATSTKRMGKPSLGGRPARRPARKRKASKRAKRGRKPTTGKKASGKRIRAVVKSMAEHKWVETKSKAILLQSSFGTNDPATTALGSAGANWVTNRNFPSMHIQRLDYADMLPTQGVGYNQYEGRKYQITGVSITGTLTVDPNAQALAFVRLHIMKYNSLKANTLDLPAGMPPGNQGYMIATTSDANIVQAPAGTLNLFDTNLGDRHPDIQSHRMGWFNHGYKLAAGWTKVKSYTLDARAAVGNENGYTKPFRIFQPIKKLMDISAPSASTSQTAYAEWCKSPMYVFMEICQLGVNDARLDSTAGNLDATNGITGVTAIVTVPRLHYIDI
jgi:hypothetical protein